MEKFGFLDWGTIISSLAGIVGTLAGYLFGRRKARALAKGIEAQAEGAELNNVERAIRLWRENAETWKGEAKTLHEENKSLRGELDTLKREYASLRNDFDNLDKRLSALSLENKTLRETIHSLTTSNSANHPSPGKE